MYTILELLFPSTNPVGDAQIYILGVGFFLDFIIVYVVFVITVKMIQRVIKRASLGAANVAAYFLVNVTGFVSLLLLSLIIFGSKDVGLGGLSVIIDGLFWFVAVILALLARGLTRLLTYRRNKVV